MNDKQSPDQNIIVSVIKPRSDYQTSQNQVTWFAKSKRDSIMMHAQSNPNLNLFFFFFK